MPQAGNHLVVQIRRGEKIQNEVQQPRSKRALIRPAFCTPSILHLFAAAESLVQELAWNPNGCTAPFRSHFDDPVTHIDVLQIH
jgi:hypothetical protein